MMFFVNEASEPSMKVDSYVLSTDYIQITVAIYYNFHKNLIMEKLH